MCESGNSKQDGFQYVYNRGRYGGSSACGNTCWCCAQAGYGGAAKVYHDVGNGWCTNVQGRRIMDPGYSWKRPHDINNFCKQACDSSPECVGYMTEDGSKCDTITTSAGGCGSEGCIVRTDNNGRNKCYSSGEPGGGGSFRCGIANIICAAGSKCCGNICCGGNAHCCGHNGQLCCA